MKNVLIEDGVSYDGQRVWYATGKKLRALDPARGELAGELGATCDAGAAYDGQFLYQLGAGHIQKIDPHTGRVLASLPSPGEGDSAGLTWAEGKRESGDARGRSRHGTRVGQGRPLLLRRRKQWKTARGEAATYALRGTQARLARGSPTASKTTLSQSAEDCSTIYKRHRLSGRLDDREP